LRADRVVRDAGREAAPDRLGADGQGLRVSRVGRLRLSGPGALRQRVRLRAQAAGEGRQGPDQPGVPDRQFLPVAGGEALNKPKGIWIAGNRLWVTDIDVVWVFDLKTRRGKKLALPGIQFANDPTVMGKALFVSDNRGDQVFRVEPADFLETPGEPKVTRLFQGKSVNPNGVYPGRDSSLLVVGFMSPEVSRGIYSVSAGGEVKTLAPALGRLDGLYQMDDGTLLITDWNSGSLLRWSTKGTETLAKGFKGPADFCVVPEAGGGLLVVVPDLVQSELRLVRLAR
jgi:hypothetical protein